jgi:mono/diheme cytochrome c family protein
VRRALKIVGIVLGVLVGVGIVAIGGFVAWVNATWQGDYAAYPAPAIHASADPAVIAEGEYLVHAVAHCPACHQPGAHTVPRVLSADRDDLSGGDALDSGPFGLAYPANLTSDAATGLGAVPDEVVARMIRHGVDRNGHLSLAMAMSIGTFSDADLTAIVSYLRTLPPRVKAVPPSEPSFLAKSLGMMVDPHAEPVPDGVPAGTISAERGEYLANGPAACYGCHSAFDLNTMAPGTPRFAGEPMAEPDPTDAAYEIAIPNLTPDPETGWITTWTEDAFVARFRAGRVYAGSKMPWESFTQMTDEDLRSLYQYLHGLPPVKRVIGPPRRPVGWTAPE